MTEHDLKAAARLAGIDITENEVASFTPQVARALESLESLQRVDATGVEPMVCVNFTPKNAWREDRARAGLDPRVVLDLAPDSSQGYIRVPPVKGAE